VFDGFISILQLLDNGMENAKTIIKNYPTDLKIQKTLIYQTEDFRRQQLTALLILEQIHLPKDKF